MTREAAGEYATGTKYLPALTLASVGAVGAPASRLNPDGQADAYVGSTYVLYTRVCIHTK